MSSSTYSSHIEKIFTDQLLIWKVRSRSILGPFQVTSAHSIWPTLDLGDLSGAVAGRVMEGNFPGCNVYKPPSSFGRGSAQPSLIFCQGSAWCMGGRRPYWPRLAKSTAGGGEREGGGGGGMLAGRSQESPAPLRGLVSGRPARSWAGPRQGEP